MKLEDIERVQDLKASLEFVENVVRAFERQKAEGKESVDCYAHSDDQTYGRGYKVKVLPISVDTAISAAIRDVSKVKAELQQLGVTV